MKFCTQCSNMLYISIKPENPNHLEYYCRNCGCRDDVIANEGVAVLTTRLKQDEQRFHHIINKYTKLDPTLPRIYSLRCPNGTCSTNVESVENPEVIYIRYDDAKLKYLYMCVECDTTWKTNDK